MMDEFNNNISVNEKLRSFTDMALREAHRKKKGMLDETEKDVSLKKKDMEINLLEEAYRSIQTGTRENRKELNEAISKTLVDGKRKMFNKRKEIIEDIFEETMEKLEQYKNTDEYEKAMKKKLQEATKLLGGKRFTIHTEAADTAMFMKITASLKLDIELEKNREKLGGGFILYETTGKKRVDCSFSTRITQAREEFLSMCRIPIDDGDLLNE